ncbi:MAG: beta-eliminating lyase-related protein [Candidatus Eremiobacteraeota bacterium]|nr:beta-eliminating lyase-related protein [Candidatus Eremiobacteraeota bacterium]
MLTQTEPLDRADVLAGCTRFFGTPPRSMKARLLEIAEELNNVERPDLYGGGELLESFESEMARLLGKEAAVFMPSGTMAQQIALRIHADHIENRNVAMHPQSHLFVSEANAFQTLHPLHGIPVGDRSRLFTLTDLEAVRERIGSLLIELPERNIGGALRRWSELKAMTDWARSRGIALQMDGARLWESQPYYDRPLAEIAGLFDSVYVSFYKVLGAIAGAALAGPKSLIDEARVWQQRHGGRLVAQYPMILSARSGLRRYLHRIPLYCKRAREIAAILDAMDGVDITPNPPPTNMFHGYVRGEMSLLEQAALRVSQGSSVWLIGRFQTTENPAMQMFELTCGEGSLSITDSEVQDLFSRAFSAA